MALPWRATTAMWISDAVTPTSVAFGVGLSASAAKEGLRTYAELQSAARR